MTSVKHGERYVIRAAHPEDLDAVQTIIRRRQSWLAEQGIDQWRDYETFFPRSYFLQRIAAGQLLVACDACGTVCAAIAQMGHDPYWRGEERADALYLHNLVAAPEAAGAGAALLDFTEKKARAEGYARLRLDCQADNPRLNDYYRSHGFSPVGTCKDGTYQGILLEKSLEDKQ